MNDTFYICERCYNKLHLLGLDLEILTVSVFSIQNCWVCEQDYVGDFINWCVKPDSMKEVEV